LHQLVEGQLRKLAEEQKKKAIKRIRKIECIDVQSRALKLGVGTQAQGNIDNAHDGDKTRRRRRKVIVLR